jgi:hypothetical protein
MRFEVGQIVPFAKVSFHPRADVDQFHAGLCRLFHPDLHVLDRIEVKLLEVAAHHKVPSEWDENPEHDGFVLREVGSDQMWHNQYPRAVYGQLDDSYDRIVVRKHDHVTPEECSAMEAAELEHLLEKWSTAQSMLETIYRALHGREHERIDLAEDSREQFARYHAQFKAEVEKVTGRRVEYRELEMGTPKRRIEGCWKAVLVGGSGTKEAA